MPKPFENLDISEHYLLTGETYYAANHPIYPDTVNAAVKALESELQGLEIPEAVTLPLQRPALSGTSAGAWAQGSRPASWEFTGIPFVFAAKIAMNIGSAGVVFRAATPDDTNIFQFMIYDIGGGVRRLYCQIGTVTLSDDDIVYLGLYPQIVGCVVTASTVKFFAGHTMSGSPVGHSATLPTTTETVVHTIGTAGLGGKVLRMGVRSYGNDLGVDSVLSQCALPDDFAEYLQPRMYYAYDGMAGAIIDKVTKIDSYGDPTNAMLPLVSGTWVEW